MNTIKKAIEKALKKAKVPEILIVKITFNLPSTGDLMSIRNYVIKELKKTNSPGLESITERFDEIFEIEIKKLDK